jgi:hypothetical protein
MRLPAGHPDYYHPDEGNQRIVAAQARTARSLERSAESNLDAVASTEQLRQARKELAQFEKEQASAGRKDRNRRALEFGRRYGLFGPPSLPREYPESEHVRRMMGMSRGGLPLFEAGGTARMRVQADELQREVQRSFAQTGGGLSARYRLSPGLAQTIAAGRVGVGAAGADRARRLNLSGALNVAGAIIGPSPRSANENVNQLRRGMRLQTSLAAAQIAYGQATTRTVDATRRALTQVGPKIASARIGMRNLASQFVGLIDPAGLLLTAILALPAVFLAIKGALDQDIKRFDDLSRSPKTVEDKQKLMQELSQESTRGTTFGEYLTELTSHRGPLENPITNIKSLFGIGENELTKMRQDAAKGLLDAEKKLAAAQKRARARGQDVPELTAEEIDKDVNQSVARYQSGRATIDAAIASVQKALRELEKTTKLDDTEKADKKEDLLNQLSQLNKEKQDAIEQEIEAQNQALDSLVQSGGATSGQLRGYIAKQVGLVNQFRGDTSAEGMQKYAEARQNLLNTLKESGQQDLDARLSNAMGDPKKIDQAYRSYEKQFRDAYRTAQGATQRRGGSGSGFVGGLRNDIGFTQTRAAETVDPKLRAQLRQIRNEREQAVFEARRAIAEARTEVATGNAPAGEPRLQLQLRAIGTLVRGAIRVYGRRAKETLALIAQQQQAEAALVEYQGESITSRSELAASRTTDPVAQARINIGGLQELLAYQRGNRKEYDANAIRSTQTQINNAEQALAETIRQQSTDLLNAHYALLESRNDDPVYQARLEAKRTAEILSRGGFQTPAERMQAAAESNNARRAAQDAAVRAQIDNIDFDVEIGKKTTEQQIAAYEKLLKNSKMGQQQKKELQRQIARLKHEAETSDQTSFELGLGNIRIPTMYEVARLVKGGPGGVTTAVNNANTVNVTVNGPQDYEELGRVLDRHVQGTGKSMARAAQMR